MTLQEAIEIISGWSKLNCPPRSPDEIDALNILIEAGKLAESLRVGVPRRIVRLLPGETSE